MNMGRFWRAGNMRGRWYCRLVRGFLPDRNPLRRACDRVETLLLAGLFVAAVVAAPFAAQAASHAAYAGALRAQQAQQAARHQVPAVLAQAADSTISSYLGALIPVQATWTSVTGVKHAGQVMATAGSAKGSTVIIWTDAAGNPTNPPLRPSQVSGQRYMAALGAVVGVGVVYLCATVIVRRVLNRRRMEAWAADWAVTARAWNRQRW
jgi:hypothetical protein